MIFFDTSYLVRLYFEDRGWEAVRNLAASDAVACAAHGQVEVVAAFHRKLREKAIDAADYTALLGQFELELKEGAVQWLPQRPETFVRIRKVYATLPATIFLRAADALHLAAAAEHGLKVVYSNDAHLLAAAAHFGLTGRNVIP